MRKQIAAANWKMNLTLQQGEALIDELLTTPHDLTENQLAVFAVPFPYLISIKNKLAGKKNVFVAAILLRLLFFSSLHHQRSLHPQLG